MLLAGPANRLWETCIGGSRQWVMGTLCWRVPPMTRGKVVPKRKCQKRKYLLWNPEIMKTQKCKNNEKPIHNRTALSISTFPHLMDGPVHFLLPHSTNRTNHNQTVPNIAVVYKSLLFPTPTLDLTWSIYRWVPIWHVFRLVLRGSIYRH